MDQDNTPADDQVEETEVVEEEPYESEGARRLRVRAAAKEEAAVTMAEEAKKAKRAKDKRLGKVPTIEGQAEFLSAAREVEKRLNEQAKEDS